MHSCGATAGRLSSGRADHLAEVAAHEEAAEDATSPFRFRVETTCPGLSRNEIQQRPRSQRPRSQPASPGAKAASAGGPRFVESEKVACSAPLLDMRSVDPTRERAMHLGGSAAWRLFSWEARLGAIDPDGEGSQIELRPLVLHRRFVKQNHRSRHNVRMAKKHLSVKRDN